MSAGPVRAARKWRPTLGGIVALVLGTVLALPLVGLFFFRVYENQLIHRTEAELIGQSAVLAAVLASEVERLGEDAPLGAALPAHARPDPAEPYHPIEPRLDLARDTLLPRRPEARPAATAPDRAFAEIGDRMAPAIARAQVATLAGFRILDPTGVVIAGRGERGLSLAHVDEIGTALGGRFRSVLRVRVSTSAPPPIYSISRGTSVRVFTAMPVIVRDRVAGVVYASRTPSNVVKHLYEERGKLAVAGLLVLGTTLLIGWTFSRFVTRPMHQLVRRTAEIGSGDRKAIRPLDHYGTRELALLSDSFLAMAGSLQERSDYLRTLAAHVSHELKSPLTSILGAAELMREALEPGAERMSEAEERRFLDNILADAGQLTAAVDRLRELAYADNPRIEGSVPAGEAIAALRAAHPALEVVYEGDPGLVLPLSAENAGIVLSHLADNAERHGGRTLKIRAGQGPKGVAVTVADDGPGISGSNAERIFEPYFTTRREAGGTGMGLAIVRSLLERHGGSMSLDRIGAPGASFTIRLP